MVRIDESAIYPCTVEGREFRISGLDGLRALAVTVVFLSHLPIALHSLGNPGWYEVFPNAGFLGVNLFFVMSGFLITHRLLVTSRDGERPSFRRFWVHRAARILPAVSVFLVVHAAYAVFAGFPPYGSVGDEVLMIVSTLLQFPHYAILADIDNLSDNGALWSLGVEGQFYLAWPLVTWFLLRRVRRGEWIVMLLVLLVVALSRHRANVYDALGSFDTYLRTDTRIESLIIGSAGAFAWMRTDLVSKRLMGALALPALAGMIVIFLNATQGSDFVWHWGMSLFDVCALVVVMGLAMGTSPLSGVLEWRPVAWVGMVSYGLYIWQVPTLHILLRHADSLGDPTQGVVAVVSTFVLATMSWYLLEKPIRSSAWVARLAGP